MTLQIIETTVDDERWQSMLAAHSATLFQGILWSELVQATYGYGMGVLLALRSGTPVAGIPFAEIDDFRGKRRIVNAFADVCEPVGDGAWRDLERAMLDHPLPWRMRSRTAPEAATKVSSDAVHQALRLDVSSAELECRLHPKTRANIRQAIDAGLTYSILDGVAALDVFYALHSRVRKEKHGLLPQPRTFFEEIAKRFFPKNGFVLAAQRDGEYFAAMMFLGYGSTLYYKFSASNLDRLRVRPNHYLLWKGVEEAVRRGYTEMDLGISDTEGLVRFKQRFGAIAAPVYTAWYGMPLETVHSKEMNAALGALTHLLTETELPLSAAQRGGDILYRFFV